MSIEFHCSHCGKRIRASKEHAGRRGECPSCHQSVYIPTPPEDLEPLRLAPVDNASERQRQKLIEDGRELAQKIMREKDLPPEALAAKIPLPEPLGDGRLKLDIETLVIEYVLCMADGNLAEAEELAVDIRKDWRRAEDVMQRLTVDEIPPAQLKGIPRPVLVGFFKQLREGKK